VLCTFSSSNGASLSRFEQLKHKSLGNGIVDLDGETLELYATGKHNFSMFVLFSTTDKSLQCQICGPVIEEFTALAQNFKSHIGGSRYAGIGYDSARFLADPVFFINCDITRCRELAMKAQFREIPRLVYIAPREEKKPTIDMLELPGLPDDFTATRMASFIREKANYPDFEINPPISNTVAWYASVIVGLYILFTRVLPLVLEYYRRPMFWFCICLGAYAFAMAGVVFNAITKPQFSYKHPQNGQLFLIYPSARHQFIAEGLIMAGLLTFAAAIFTSFGAYVPTFKGDWPKRGIFLVLLLCFYMVYDGIFRIFKMKYNYYPFY